MHIVGIGVAHSVLHNRCKTPLGKEKGHEKKACRNAKCVNAEYANAAAGADATTGTDATTGANATSINVTAGSKSTASCSKSTASRQQINSKLLIYRILKRIRKRRKIRISRIQTRTGVSFKIRMPILI